MNAHLERRPARVLVADGGGVRKLPLEHAHDLCRLSKCQRYSPPLLPPSLPPLHRQRGADGGRPQGSTNGTFPEVVTTQQLRILTKHGSIQP